MKTMYKVITIKDIEKLSNSRMRERHQGRLLVAAAVVLRETEKRAEKVNSRRHDAWLSILHGHSQGVLDAIKDIRSKFLMRH